MHTRMRTYTHAHTCMYPHAYTHAHTRTRMHTHEYRHTRAHTCMYTHAHTCMHTCMHTHACTHMHVHTCMRTHACTHMHAHACTPMHTHMHAHTCTCMHARTHTHTHSHHSAPLYFSPQHLLPPAKLCISFTYLSISVSFRQSTGSMGTRRMEFSSVLFIAAPPEQSPTHSRCSLNSCQMMNVLRNVSRSG
uniref:Uncharacterized protein n=1 Tax=Rousettus aegyptiacus TaxID=9407 RepID=A0A7J8KAL4_ROUAE|nr:hypothetical protein HJG63_007784 [Rousettus aegyptiacus]